MAALCKALTKSAGIGLSITAVCKNAGKKTLEQDDFFVVSVSYSPLLEEPKFKSLILAIIIIELYIYIYIISTIIWLLVISLIFLEGIEKKN